MPIDNITVVDTSISENPLLSWADPIGNVSSVLGLFISLVGFGITIWTLQKTKGAAEAAKEEAERVRLELRKASAISDFSVVVSMLDEIKRLQRLKAWSSLPDRYSGIRQKLIALRTAGFALDDAKMSSIQNAITVTSKIENDLEKIIASSANPDPVKFNKIISAQIDAISEILASILAK